MSNHTLLPFPAWISNPYLNLLHLAVRGDGWNVIAGVTTVDALESTIASLHEGDVVHIHWTSPILAGVVKEDEAVRRAAKFTSVLSAAKARGLRLLWTVHNIIAHDSAFPHVDESIARFLAEHADLVIQLHDHTSAAVANSYTLDPNRLATVRLASYLGVYPDHWTDEEAREFIGVPQGVPTVGFLGQIRPYKGLDVLVAAIEAAQEAIPDLTLVIAGKVFPEDRDEVNELLGRSKNIVSELRFVPDGAFGAWHRASDVIVLPFRKILNSSSLTAAATFDRHVIIPDDTPLAAVYESEPWVTAYPTAGDEVANLSAAIQAHFTNRRDTSAAAHAFTRAFTPYDMSRAYLHALDSLAHA